MDAGGYLGELAVAAGRPAGADPALEAHLVAELAAAAERWPEVPVDRPALWRAIAARLEEAEPLASVAGWQLADLHLATACLAGNQDALRALDRMLHEVAVPAAASRRLGRAEIDEVVQQLRTRLLVGGVEARPGLISYSGRGRLAGFVRSAAVRGALNLRRDEQRRGTSAPEGLLDGAAQDPELAHMKRVYLDEFRRALAAAWNQLPAEERLFLRHQLDDELTIDDLAAIYGMHRSTAARRLAAARDRLLSTTRRDLRRHLEIGDSEVESVLRLIRSRLGDAADALGDPTP